MAIWNRSSTSSDEPKVARDAEFGGKTEYEAHASYDPAEGEVQQAGEKQNLHRGLEARHITMIAIGGAIGMWRARCGTRTELTISQVPV